MLLYRIPSISRLRGALITSILYMWRNICWDGVQLDSGTNWNNLNRKPGIHCWSLKQWITPPKRRGEMISPLAELAFHLSPPPRPPGFIWTACLWLGKMLEGGDGENAWRSEYKWIQMKYRFSVSLSLSLAHENLLFWIRKACLPETMAFHGSLTGISTFVTNCV